MTIRPCFLCCVSVSCAIRQVTDTGTRVRVWLKKIMFSFVEMVQRIQNLEAEVEDARTQIGGTTVRVTVIEQNVAEGTANISNETKRKLNITTYKGFQQCARLLKFPRTNMKTGASS